MGIYDLAAQQNRANRVYSYIESADQDDLMQVIAAIMDRLDEVDADGLAGAWEHLDSALAAIKHYDPRHKHGCACPDCREARTERRLNVYFDNLARI